MSIYLFKFAEKKYRQHFEFCYLNDAKIVYFGDDKAMKILTEHASTFRRIETGVISKVGLCILNVSNLLQFLHFNA